MFTSLGLGALLSAVPLSTMTVVSNGRCSAEMCHCDFSDSLCFFKINLFGIISKTPSLVVMGAQHTVGTVSEYRYSASKQQVSQSQHVTLLSLQN